MFWGHVYRVLVLFWRLLYTVFLRSNFNSRGVNSRELLGFFGHSSLSHHAILTKIGGSFPTSVPELSIASKAESEAVRVNFLEVKISKTITKQNHEYLRLSVGLCRIYPAVS